MPNELINISKSTYETVNLRVQIGGRTYESVNLRKRYETRR